MSRTATMAGVVAAAMVTGSLMTPVASAQEDRPTPWGTVTTTGRLDPPRIPDDTVPATSRGTVNNYWGLPVIAGAGTKGQPMTYAAQLFRGYRHERGTKRYLPGLHPRGVHVRRGKLPTISRLRLSGHSRVTVSAKVTAHAGLRGKVPAKAHEKVLIVVQALKPGRPVEQRRVLDRHRRWFAVKDFVTHGRVRVQLSRQATRVLRVLSPAQRRKAVQVTAVHLIDADGRRFNKRFTVDHLKTTVATPGRRGRSPNPRAIPREQDTPGGSVNLTMVNNDYAAATQTWLAPNVTASPVSCMTSSDDYVFSGDAYSVTGMTPSQTEENAFTQSLSGNPVYQGSSAGTVIGKMTEQIAVGAVEEGLDDPLALAQDAFTVFADLAKLLDQNNCSENPGLMTLSATDTYGNNTNQAYGVWSADNTSQLATQFNVAGFVDAASLTGQYSFVDYSKAPAQVYDYLISDFMDAAYALGPLGDNSWQWSWDQWGAFRNEPWTYTSGGGGDSGLALQTTTQDWTYSGSNDLSVQMSVNFDGGCSSQFTAWSGPDPLSDTPDELWENWAVEDPCAGSSASPTGNPFPAPEPDSLGTLSHCSAATGDTVSVTPGTWAQPNTQVSYQWYVSEAGGELSVPPSSDWTALSGATGPSYTAGSQVGYLGALVTGTNPSGSQTVIAVNAGIPLNNIGAGAMPWPLEAPVLNGSEAFAGTPISVNQGLWQCSVGLTYTVQWYNASSADAIAGLPISGATGYTYTPTSGQVGRYIFAEITATSTAGSYSAKSANVYVEPATN